MTFDFIPVHVDMNTSFASSADKDIAETQELANFDDWAIFADEVEQSALASTDSTGQVDKEKADKERKYFDEEAARQQALKEKQEREEEARLQQEDLQQKRAEARRRHQAMLSAPMPIWALNGELQQFVADMARGGRSRRLHIHLHCS
ncbi:hypothetical protein BGX33_010192 [Mortierella sp. NVP41]|nr:hypothetical protein BGX33_010192 [Mortierella sp. NVP41]